MKAGVFLRIGVLVVGTTGFYTLVGQLVPQKEIQPPQELVLAKDMSQADMMKTGRQIMEGKGLCLTCHTIGKKSGPFRFPDLDGVGARAAHRVPGLTAVQYLAQSIYEPNAFIVPGFSPGMPVINKPPIGLTDQEILCVISYLQSLGGTVTVTMSSKVWPLEAAQASAPAASASPTTAGPAAVAGPAGGAPARAGTP